jgi:hypothetical protein
VVSRLAMVERGGALFVILDTDMVSEWVSERVGEWVGVGCGREEVVCECVRGWG